MRTVDYSDLLRGSAGLAGMNYVPGDPASDIGQPEFRLFRTFHDRRLQVAWEIHRWPDLCPVEQRHYRPVWDGATNYFATNEVFEVVSGRYFQALVNISAQPPTIGGVENSAYWAECKNGYTASDWVTGHAYAVGDQVRDPATDRYYQCHTAHTSAGSLDLDNFGLLTPFNKYIAYEQVGETAIGEYFVVSNKDPRVTTQTITYPFWLSQDGAQLGANVPNTVWVYFRTRRPVLSGEIFDATATYAGGAQVYYVTAAGVGNFYTASSGTDAPATGETPESNPESWTLVALPYFLRGYLIEGGYADWLVADQRGDEAAAHESFAENFLELEADKLQRQQQQVRRLQAA